MDKREEKRLYDRKRYLEKRDEVLARDKKRRLRDPNEGKRRAGKWAREHPKKISIICARTQLKLKMEVLTHYGGGLLQCAHCDDKRIDCLSLDHINNDGYEHRKRIGSVNIYRLLKKQGYPDGYQVLCMNCQWIKRAEHQRQRRLASK